jgi:hypothetical protein
VEAGAELPLPRATFPYEENMKTEKKRKWQRNIRHIM